MTHEEELELCLKMGVREDWAEDLLSSLNGINGSALPILRLLRSLTDYLSYYEGGCAERLKNDLAKGSRVSIPEENLIKKGATPEEIQELAFYHIRDTIEYIMNLLTDCRGNEPKLFEDEAFSECGHVGLAELGADGKLTGKYCIYPQGAEFEEWFKNDE